ncbi:outer membrane lipoprotein-sorting protein [bacterium]|nr:outer membrane lipoprotein-sorting protein [bacterium]RQV94286.1 MAG: outer membrane lipoprotein-sorting protein [bacterium]
MKKIISLLFILNISVSAAQTPSGEWILERIDENWVSGNKIYVTNMVIHGRRGADRTIQSKSWIQGSEKSFTEYLSPAREKGTKMLKLEDQLWTYTPSTDRTIQISGHMLRQSVMGSDLSYEDMMEDTELKELYDAEVTGEDTVISRPCWVVELTAKTSDVAYYSRKMWVDKERFVVLRAYLYAKSGKLLKTTEIKNVIRVQGRWVPNVIVFKDALKEGEGTEFIIESVEFDVDIPDYIFTKAALRR